MLCSDPLESEISKKWIKNEIDHKMTKKCIFFVIFVSFFKKIDPARMNPCRKIKKLRGFVYPQKMFFLFLSMSLSTPIKATPRYRLRLQQWKTIVNGACKCQEIPVKQTRFSCWFISAHPVDPSRSLAPVSYTHLTLPTT